MPIQMQLHRRVLSDDASRVDRCIIPHFGERKMNWIWIRSGGRRQAEGRQRRSKCGWRQGRCQESTEKSGFRRVCTRGFTVKTYTEVSDPFTPLAQVPHWIRIIEKSPNYSIFINVNEPVFVCFVRQHTRVMWKDITLFPTCEKVNGDSSSELSPNAVTQKTVPRNVRNKLWIFMAYFSEFLFRG